MNWGTLVEMFGETLILSRFPDLGEVSYSFRSACPHAPTFIQASFDRPVH